LLGLGSPARFLSYAAFSDKLVDHHISYDSTTHSHAIFKGLLIDGLKVHSWNSLYPNKKQEFVDLINEFISKTTDLRITLELMEGVYSGSLKYEQATGKLGVRCEKFIFCTVATFAFMVHTQMNVMEDLLKKGKTYNKIAEQRGGLGAYKALSMVNNPADFQSWYNQFARHMSSDRVQSVDGTPLTLDDFF